MFNEIENPFSVTKAIEFSDSEIFQYWVDLYVDKDNNIEFLLNPSEYLPKYIIGSRGCGKTHLLRYFSTQSKLLKYNNNVRKLLKDEKYIGIYNTFSILNSSKFKGDYLSFEQWQQIFNIYFELYLTEILLNDIKKLINITGEKITNSFFGDVKKLFINHDALIFQNIDELISHIIGEKNKIEKELINATFNRKFSYDSININFISGEFVISLANLIKEKIELFDDIKFIFILDEYDKLLDWQKIYINTLVWDKKPPITFWIGARTYGYNSRQTLTGATLKSGSDFQEILLDDYIRENKNYKEFSKQLVVKRLEKYYSERQKVDSKLILENFISKFIVYDEKLIIKELIEKVKDKEYVHVRDLKFSLKKEKDVIKNQLSIKENDLDFNDKINDYIEGIITNLVSETEDNPIIQKYNFFYFYKLWFQNRNNKKINFLNLSVEVNKNCIDYMNGKDSYHKVINEKWKKDLISQLLIENRLKNFEYTGFDSFIELSNGNVRSLILLLKNTIENSSIRGEKPLEDNGFISIDSQYLSAYRVAEWYYNDAEIFGDEAKKLYSSIKKLTDYLKLYRASNNLPEKNVLGFYFREKEVSVEVSECIKLLEEYSFLIKSDNGRKEKSGIGIEESKYYLNPIMSPLWNLSMVVGGTPLFTSDLMKVIFDLKHNDLFEKTYKDRKSELNAPFVNNNQNNSPTIFDKHE